jgi:hypothetical protein
MKKSKNPSTQVQKRTVHGKKVRIYKTDLAAFKNLERRLINLGFKEGAPTRIVDIQKEATVPDFDNQRIKVTADQTLFQFDLKHLRLEISSTFNKTLNEGKGEYSKKYGALQFRIILLRGIPPLKKPLYHLKFNRGSNPRGMNDKAVLIAKLLIVICKRLDSIISKENLTDYGAQKELVRDMFQPIDNSQSFDATRVRFYAQYIICLENREMIDLYVSIVRNRFYYWREKQEDGTYRPVRHSEKKRTVYKKNTKYIHFKRENAIAKTKAKAKKNN